MEKNNAVKIYRGVLTGFNEAFIIDTETKNKILFNCETEEERKRTEEIIKPVLRGRDIRKYYYKWAGLWLIKIEAGWTNKNRGKEKPEEFFKKIFPSIYQHLISFANKEFENRKKGLLNRDDQGDYWWELRPCDYYPEFEKEKIVWNRITEEIVFSYVEANYYVLDSTFMLTGENLKFLISILNSNVISFWIKLSAATLGKGNYGAKIYIENSPIPPITLQNQLIVQQIESIVDKILTLTQNPTYDTDPQKQAQVKSFEKQIDQLVYKLYGLTEDEIEILVIKHDSIPQSYLIVKQNRMQKI